MAKENGKNTVTPMNPLKTLFLNELVGGYKQLENKVTSILSDIGDMSTISTTAKTLVGAINELKTSITNITTKSQGTVTANSTYSQSPNIKADKCGNVVHLHGTIQLKSVTQPSNPAAWQFATIPTGYRPKYSLTIPVSLSSAVSNVTVPQVSISTAGTISCASTYYAAVRTMYIDTTYILA